MAFRSGEYLQRNELVRYQLDDVIRSPGDNQHQVKNGYKFTINDRSSFYDWYNAYFEVQFQLQKLADGDGYADADRVTVINNSHSLIKHLMITSAGKIVYDTDNLHNVTFVKNLLEYSDDYSRSVAKNTGKSNPFSTQELLWLIFGLERKPDMVILWILYGY